MNPASSRVSHPGTRASAKNAPTADQARSPLHLCGLNHLSAPLALREYFALSRERCADLARDFKNNGLSDQIMILSTCNRTEIYAFSERPRFAAQLRDAFLSIPQPPNPELDTPPLYEYTGPDAVHHLFAVGAGLDSQILGENQIKQQVREAYEISRSVGTDGPDLRRVIQAAHRVGKRIRTQTQLNVGTLCVGKAATLKAEAVMGGLTGKVCMVIGAGKVGAIAARAIAERRPGRLWVVNRSVENARQIADELGGEAYGLDSLACLLPEAEFILGAAYAPELILDRDVYERACVGRERPALVCMVDAAVPRILDPALGSLGGVKLFDLERLEEVTESNRARRRDEAVRAWAVVDEEVEKYQAAVQAAELAPRIRRLRSQFETIIAEELDQLSALHPPQAAPQMKLAQHRIKQRLLHEAIRELKELLLG